MQVVFDIESNGLLDSTVVHSLVIRALDADTSLSCSDHDGYTPISEGIKLLNEADEIIGHNIVKFDIQVLKNLYTSFSPRGKVTDTLILSRLIYPDLFLTDGESKQPAVLRAKKVFGSHSLKAWGIRLGKLKDSFGESSDWKTWSKEMQEYCEQDVYVQCELYKFFSGKEYSKEAINIEHRFQEIILMQELEGIPFDRVKAKTLLMDLKTALNSTKKELNEIIPKEIVEDYFIPKANNSKYGYTKGQAVIRRKEIEFNPGSRDQIVKYLQSKYGWSPDVFTDKGNPKMDSEVLSLLEYAETDLISKYLDANKIIGRLESNKGKGGWLVDSEGDSRIHASMITNGTITGRCAHRVLSNVPRVSSYLGKECRELFYAGKDRVMVGCDASQLELRMLAHYLGAYDRGVYTKAILEGDIHTVNQKAAGLSTRDQAKTFIYALLYGAGQEKLGSIVSPQSGVLQKREDGKKLKDKFFSEMPAFMILSQTVVKIAEERGYLKGLDGRLLQVRESYRALNTLLQGAGAVVMKKATCIMWDLFKEHGLLDVVIQAINYHDENQVIVTDPSKAEQVGCLMVQAIRDTGTYFNLRCPLDGQYKVGNNWAETH